MNIDKLSDENLQDMFEEAFEEQVGKLNNIDEFEAKCERTIGAGGDITIHLMIVGLAGTPTVEDFKENRLGGIDRVDVDLDATYPDGGMLEFKLVPEEVISLNTNDYDVVYRLTR